MDPVTWLLVGGKVAVGAIITWIKGHTVLVAVLAVAGVSIASWAYIVHQFTVTIIPFLRSTLGDTIADGMAALISHLDDVATLLQRNVSIAWRAFKSRLLSWKTTFKKTTASTATSHSEAYVLASDGKVIKRVIEEEVPWAELPEDIRHAFMRNQGRDEVVDSKDLTERIVRATATEKGVDLDSDNG